MIISIGTTRKGIGPTYSSKASRSGLRVHHLYNFEEFSEKFRTLVENKHKRYGAFEHDVEAELARYKVRPSLLFVTKDCILMDYLLPPSYG